MFNARTDRVMLGDFLAESLLDGVEFLVGVDAVVQRSHRLHDLRVVGVVRAGGQVLLEVVDAMTHKVHLGQATLHVQ